MASYEDGGLERLFTTMLTCQCWDTPLLAAFQHFLVKHISFDSDPDGGHGALARHLAPDVRVERLWQELHTCSSPPSHGWLTGGTHERE